MPGHDIIVVGASAGGVEALVQLVSGLPADFPASLFVVLHVSPHGSSVLPEILNRRGRLRAHHPQGREPITPGRIFVAPPDHHLVIRPGWIALSRGPTENGVRPSVDPLFRTAARSYGARVVGVILSGNLDDGTAGLAAVKQRRGVAIVQDPGESMFSGMPRSALEAVDVDACLPITEIAARLVELANTPVSPEEEAPMTDEIEYESEMAEFNLGAIESHRRPGIPSGFACPDCAGALWELRDGELIRFRCRVGHAWSATSLLAEQSEALETALWTALRTLEERAALADRLADQLSRRNTVRSADRFREQAEVSRARAAVIRQVLQSNEPSAESTPDDEGKVGEVPTIGDPNQRKKETE